MKKFDIHWFVSLLLCFFMALQVAQSQPKRGTTVQPKGIRHAEEEELRFALVMGNNNYQNGNWGQLQGAGNDANLMINTFKACSFDHIFECKNGKRRDMINAIHQFTDSIAAAKRRGHKVVAIVFYAGHGSEGQGINYLIPIDDASKEYADMSASCISLDKLREDINDAKADLSLFFIDACRDRGLGGNKTKGFNNFSVREQAVLSFSTGLHQAALDVKKGYNNSPYTLALAKVIQNNNLELSDVLKEVGKQMEGDNQTPWVYTNFYGKFYFHKQKPNECAYTEKTNGLNFDMLCVKGGLFSMGEDNSENNDAKPAHKVTLKSFYIGKSEVTNEEFCFFLNSMRNQLEFGENGKIIYKKNVIFDIQCTQGDNGECKSYRENIEYDKAQNTFYVVAGFEKHPAVMVTWYGAVAYCEWLCAKSNKKYRLPTEAEWEYAAKANEIYAQSGSDYIATVAWFYGNTVPFQKNTQMVAQKSANAFGIFDMIGNAWEWCMDSYDENFYRTSAPENPICTNNRTKMKVLRGGSWITQKSQCNAIFRNKQKPNMCTPYFGFRVVCDE